jgi:hypothetical protein
MIGKVLRGRNVRRLLYYLYGPGKANEHTDPHLVAGFSDPAEFEPERRPDGSRDFRRLTGLLEQPLAALAGPGYNKPVWHCAVRAAPDDRMLSDAEWAQVAALVMDRTGLAPEGDEMGVRWVAIRHAADHVHIVATLASQDGTQPRIWNDFFRVREACQDAERVFGLRSTAPADRTAAKRPTRAESEQATRRGWGEPPRATLRREVCAAAAGARTEQEFFVRLEQAGVLVRKRGSVTKPGEVTGYAVGLAHHTTRDGSVVWYGGGKLAADLTLPKLLCRLAAAAGHDPLAGQEVPAAVARAVLRNTVADVAGRAQDEAEFFEGLRQGGVQVRLRFSETVPGQVTGYAVTLPGHRGRDGAPVWYGGGRLAAGLTLPRLRQRWRRQRNTGSECSGAFRFTGPERETIYRHAARHAAAAAEHIRRCSVTDPGRGADAAWAAADTLHVAARALRNPALRCAADIYDRAARAPHGRIPDRTRDGERLRAVARLMALAGSLTGDGALAVAALMASLVALAAAVAELRLAQQHAAQAAAARAAVGHLHTAMTQARERAAHFTQAPRRSRTGNAADTARRDFPVPLRLENLPAADPAASHAPARPRRGHLPPRRAGPRR